MGMEKVEGLVAQSGEAEGHFLIFVIEPDHQALEKAPLGLAGKAEFADDRFADAARTVVAFQQRAPQGPVGRLIGVAPKRDEQCRALMALVASPFDVVRHASADLSTR